MTDQRSDREDWRALAAEYALRLPEGEDRLRAERLMSSDREFVAEVARWRGRLEPLVDELDPAVPPPDLWKRIERAIGGGGDNVVTLRRQVTTWRAATAAISALAASLAVVLLIPRQAIAPTPPAEVRPASAPMVAMLDDNSKEMKAVATWDPAASQLVLAVVGDMPADPLHSHELWVIPSDGKPRSLGTMPASKQAHMELADALAGLLQQGATIAISVEPPGGSPRGSPTGPVVASGALTRT